MVQERNIMDKIKSTLDRAESLFDSVRTLLTGEAARFIGYGSAVVMVGFIAVANALGITRFGEGMSLTDALILTTAAITFVVGVIESIRKFVYSFNSVAAIAANAAVTGDPTPPPPPATV
jgi:hypothetical protein